MQLYPPTVPLGWAEKPSPQNGFTYSKEKATLELLGMTLIEVDLQPKDKQKLDSCRGVAALVVDQNLEAFRAGVRSGDLVAEVNSCKIRKLHDMRKVLSNHDPLDPLFVFLLNGDGWRFTNLSFISGMR
jgi:S1-C subfamily serine protease